MSQSKYELIYILDVNSTAEEIAAVATKVEQVTVELQGVVLKKEEWGRRRLAYRVQKHREGHYVFYELTLDAKAVEEVCRNLRLMEKVIKFMAVKEEISRRKIKPARKRTPRPPGSEMSSRPSMRPNPRPSTPVESAPKTVAPVEAAPQAETPAS
jgi:small subunit ribosomal protein S6